MTLSRCAAEGRVSSSEFGHGPGKSVPPACGLQAQTPLPELPCGPTPSLFILLLLKCAFPQACLLFLLMYLLWFVCFFLIQIIYMRLTSCKGT